MQILRSDKSTIHIKENSWIAKIASLKLKTNSMAIVLGKTIHLYNTNTFDFVKDEKWMRHELCHVDQFKKYGYLNFIFMYLWESLRKGYHNNKFEIEARQAEVL